MGKLYQDIANAIIARKNCIKSGNNYITKWDEKLDNYEKDLPSGSGIDNGCTIDLEKSDGKKIVINTSFHHMDENGFYDGWTKHTIIVTPSFDGIDIRITGKNRNDIKDSLSDVIYNALQ